MHDCAHTLRVGADIVGDCDSEFLFAPGEKHQCFIHYIYALTGCRNVVKTRVIPFVLTLHGPKYAAAFYVDERTATRNVDVPLPRQELRLCYSV